MTRWQKRARLAIAAFAILFLVVLVRQLRPRPTPASQTAVPRTDPGAAIEVTGGRVDRFRSSRQDVSVESQKQLVYPDGSMKLTGVTLVTDERGGNRRFTVTGKEGRVGKDDSTLTLDGDVRIEASDGLVVRTGHATYSDSDGIVRAPGPVEFTRGRLKGSGIGMEYDKSRDALKILQQAVVRQLPDAKGRDSTDVTSGTAEFARREKFVRFDTAVTMQRGRQTIGADGAMAYLSENGERIDTLELRGNSRITASKPDPGALQALTGRDVNLKYAPDGESLQHALVVGDGVVQLAGEPGKEGREIKGNMIDIALAPDGSTPTALVARENVVLTMPEEAGASGKTIRSNVLESKGEGGRGLTRALFTGNVQYRERGADVARSVNAETLDVGLKRGFSAIEHANFSHGVKFVQDAMTAYAAVARYDVDNGTLELSGSEPSARVPHVDNAQIAVDATKIDVVLDGPKVRATGTATEKIKSVLQPQKKDAQKPGDATIKMPSMLKQDQLVNVTAAALEYDGTTSKTTYTGATQLWQGDTSIKGETIAVDGKNGDLVATAVTSTTMLEQTDKKTNQKERVRSVATAKDLKYEDALRRLTYTGDAHMSSPDGDMTAARIELYLKPSGDELERAEAHENVTLREQNRKTTGTRMTYTTADERYVIVGAPVKIVDECERETIGRTLTFLKSTDSIVIDGNQQIRTQTKGGRCSS